MVKLPQILAKTHVTRNAYRHWGLIGALKTEQPETSMGKAVPYSRENALEIAFIGALVRAGLTPLDASERAQAWIETLKNGHSIPRYYVLNPISGFGFGREDISQPDALMKMSHALNQRDKSGWVEPVEFAQLHIINLKHLIKMVDEMFEEEGA